MGKITGEGDQEEDDDEDIEAAIKKEVAEMGNKTGTMKLITPVPLDLACVLFFKTMPPIEPVDFVQRICEEAVKNPAGRKTRFANRLTPMKLMGRATEKGLEEVGREVLGEYFQLEASETEQSKIEVKPDAEGKDFSVSPSHTYAQTNVPNIAASDKGPD